MVGFIYYFYLYIFCNFSAGPGIHFVDHADLEHRDSPGSASQLLD